MQAWDIEGIYPSQYTAETVTTTNRKLEEHSLIKDYRDATQAVNSTPETKPNAVAKPKPTRALDLLGRGASRMILMNDGHLDIILNNSPPYHPFAEEQELLKSEVDGDSGGRLRRTKSELEKIRNDRNKYSGKSMYDYLRKPNTREYRYIPSLDLKLITSDFPVWFKDVSGGRNEDAWLVQVDKELTRRISDVDKEKDAISTTIRAFRESNEVPKFTCTVSGHRYISPIDGGPLIRIPLAPPANHDQTDPAARN